VKFPGPTRQTAPSSFATGAAGLAPIADAAGTDPDSRRRARERGRGTPAMRPCPAAAAARATRSIPDIPNSTVRSSSVPSSERATAGRYADDAIVDLEHAGDRMRNLLGPLTQASAASRSGKRHLAVGDRHRHAQRRHRDADERGTDLCLQKLVGQRGTLVDHGKITPPAYACRKRLTNPTSQLGEKT
jgi:hypothetical protein